MRARPASRLPAGFLLLSAMVATCVLSACGAVDNAHHVVDRASLVNDLANRLSQAATRTYTAVYQLPGGQTATLAQAQKPTRASFTYPAGKLIVTPNWTADCQTGTATACGMSPAPSPATDIPEALLTKISEHGLVAPTTVVGLLAAAALDRDASIQQHDTTIAGEWVTCVDVSGVDNTPAPQFSACITAAGVLASFTGDVDGHPIDIHMTGYATTTTPDAFTVPTNAKITGSPTPSQEPATTPSTTPS